VTILEAVRDGDVAAIRELLEEEPALVGEVDEHGKTPLHLAAELDHADVAELLLESGADLETLTNWGATPLQWAGVLGSRRAAEVLLARGAGLTLPAAAGLGLQHALDVVWDPEAVDDAFVLACRNGHTQVASVLLERGANVNARGFFAATGLHWAAINGHEDTVRFLLAAGADPALRDEEFDSDALGWAREGGHGPAVAALS
jgi:ankyrin repeat protein